MRDTYNVPKLIARVARPALLSLLLAFGWAQTSLADSTTYLYQGPQFTTFIGTDSCSMGAGECAITVSMTLAQPLADNFNGSVIPTAFTMSDGTNQLTQASSLVVDEFDFITDSTGAIIAWHVALQAETGGAVQVLVTSNDLGGECKPGFIFGDGSCSGNVTTGYQGIAGTSPGDSGSWSVVPEPSTLEFLFTGSLPLAAALLRRKRLA